VTVICMSDQLLYKVRQLLKLVCYLRLIFCKCELFLSRHPSVCAVILKGHIFFHQHMKYRSCTQFVDKASCEYWNGVFVHAFEYPLFRCWV
jgi:hypothetical protein